MPIVVNLDVMMARRRKGAGELAEEIGITPANLSILKNNKAIPFIQVYPKINAFGPGRWWAVIRWPTFTCAASCLGRLAVTAAGP